VGAAAGGLVRDGDTGLVVAPDDVAALGQALSRLLGDRELRERLGERARAAVSAFTYDAMEAAFAQALTRCASAPDRG
jgi:glycosyltransferase involved in cell wall biosynthesis